MAGRGSAAVSGRGVAALIVILGLVGVACSRPREESRSSDLGPAATVAAAGNRVPEEVEIRQMLGDYLRAFNRHDAPALVAHWNGAAENIDLDSGTVTRGRDAVQQVFQALFSQDPRAAIDIDVQSVRPIRADVAVVDGVSRISFSEGGAAASRFSAVVVKESGRWLLESVREAAHPAEPAPQRPLDALAWLVGSWEDDGTGVTASTQCDWSAGRAFLVRSHRVLPEAEAPGTPAAGDDRIPGLLATTDARPRELTEIIGWDPERQVIHAWIFTSEGRFAEADWRPDGDHWRLEVNGRGADAGQTCVCTLSAVAADRLSFQCASDRMAGVLPPGCAFSRTAR